MSTIKRLRDRLALYQKIKEQKPVIWYHGSSLGEVLSLIPLMKEFKKHYDHVQVLTVNTVRGEAIALQKKAADYLFFFPYDAFFATQKAMRKISPKIIVILETEIWPDFFWQAAKNHQPIIIVSGRISEKSFPKYYLARFFFHYVLQKNYCLMRSEDDAKRMKLIGANPQNIKVFGDIKYDGLQTDLSEADKKTLSDFPQKKRVIVAGSTHSGEEEILCRVFKKLQQDFQDLCLILVPRHLERLEEVQKTVSSYGLDFCLRSQLPQQQSVIIGDTYGELRKMYYISEVVFVGGSLVPIGGHNVMEAACFAKPVISGKYVSNFRRHVQSLKSCHGIRIVENETALYEAIISLLHDADEAKAMGKRGQKVVLENQGAIKQCVDFLIPLAK
ncbi:3-deoxy-D-manno-octulosonic acid transferase [Candidatus Uabimicrobium amorphum]|uniref:3-deoxy-D-manno-octulosonic acid transferase n=1 Tax=Uabimicrobium amorphum TaxID=2596890 RepID=UPI0015652AE5|nr:glycosyltransferase N-terminal domain-containing protein [Candidatus Uabimicrobium amorphum]